MNLLDIIKDTERIFIEPNIPEAYKIDYAIPTVADVYAVAKPINQEEVIALVQFAIEKDLKIIARGAGTGVSGSQTPVLGGELIIDLSLMNKIIDFDEETLTLTLEPGVLLEEIQNFVESKGYFYPPDPGSKHSTIGGNVATNAGGMRAVKYGTTRDYVRAMDVVLPTGEATTLGSLNIKSSSGYDLKDLFIGSEGTLGIITQLKLKVIPMPKHQKSVVLAFNDVVEATDGVLTILQNGIDPSALELFERDTIKYSEQLLNMPFQSQKGDAYILMTLDGNEEEAIERRVERVIELLNNQALEILPLTKEEEEKAWQLRDAILYALMEFTQYELLDEVVPINQFGVLMRYTKELKDKYGINLVSFGHAGDGNVHTALMKEQLDDETWAKKRALLLDDLYNKVKELGGLPSAEHGIGLAKKPYMPRMIDPVALELMRKIKEAVDPDNRLNPGKIF